MDYLTKFDAFSKPLKDYRIQTVAGAAVSIICTIIIGVAIITEINEYLSPQVIQEIFIDTVKNDRMTISIDITFPKVNCEAISLDAVDVTGNYPKDLEHSIHKTPLDATGNPTSEPKRHVVNAAAHGNSSTEDCGSCYGAENTNRKCCNTCQDIINAYRERGWATVDLSNFKQCVSEGRMEKLSGGCRIDGDLLVNKVAGSFHLSPGRTMEFFGAHVHDVSGLNLKSLDMSYTINKLQFGKPYPGIKNPMDSNQFTYPFTSPAQFFYLKLVPTSYDSEEDDVKSYAYQFSMTSLSRRSKYSEVLVANENESNVDSEMSNNEPGLFFQYEISPVLVQISVRRRSILHSLVNICVVIGGIYTVASMLDAFLYRSSCFLAKRD